MCRKLAEPMDELTVGDADSELFEHVRRAGFTGPAWDMLADSLVQHGMKVLEPWIRTGLIFDKAAEKGRPLNPTKQEENLVATRWVEDFVQESVSNALHRFRRNALQGRGWRAEGGASLAVYFIGACIFAFVEHFRKCRRSGELYEVRFVVDLVAPTGAVDLLDFAASESDHAQSVVDRLALRSQLARLPQRDRGLVWGKANGYRGAEIAELFGWTSARAVERRWARLRRDHAWIRRLAGEEH